MIQNHNPKEYNLEERTRIFALDVRVFVSSLPKNTRNFEDGKQLIRSSGSIGANYIEANESVSNKDFILRIKIARKEAKETTYWMSLVDDGNNTITTTEKKRLIQEGTELRYILSAILRNSKL